MLAAVLTLVFIARSAVKFVKTVRVFGEVRGDPVKDDTETFFVEGIDEIHEIVRCAEAGGRGVIAADLIAPASVIRVLGDGQDFDMCIAHILCVVG